MYFVIVGIWLIIFVMLCIKWVYVNKNELIGYIFCMFEVGVKVIGDELDWICGGGRCLIICVG